MSDLKGNQLYEQPPSPPVSDVSAGSEEAMLCTSESGKSKSSVAPGAQLPIGEGIPTTSSSKNIPLRIRRIAKSRRTRHPPRQILRRILPKPSPKTESQTPKFNALEPLRAFLRVDRKIDCLRFEADMAISEGKVQDGDDMFERRSQEEGWVLEEGAAGMGPGPLTERQLQLIHEMSFM